MSTTARLITADDLLGMPKDGSRHELVKGELTTMSPSGGEHGFVTFRLTLLLGNFITQHQLGIGLGAETGFILSRNPDTVRAPDFAFIPKERISEDGISTKFLTVVPALVVEVLSPSDSFLDVAEKIEEWLNFGVSQVWLVNSKLQNVTIYGRGQRPLSLGRADELDGAEILPGLRVLVGSLFV